MSKLVTTELSSIKDIFELDNFFLEAFIFRGQIDSDWLLETSIERAMKKYSYLNDSTTGYEAEEKWMITEFSKKYSLYSNRIPSDENYFEWLAIMQHYGAPTRLLDFTYSFFVALYFATIESEKNSCIWFLNRFQLKDKLNEKNKLGYRKDESLKDEINDLHIAFSNKFIANQKDLTLDQVQTIIPLEPNFFTERLANQQGLFLMPSDSRDSFNNNLIQALDLKFSEFKKIKFEELIKHSIQKPYITNLSIIKLIIPYNIHAEIQEYLYKINITAETLFSGIEGLAKSLLQKHIYRYSPD